MTMNMSAFVDIEPTPLPSEARYESMNIFLCLSHELETPIRVDPDLYPKGLYLFQPINMKTDPEIIYYQAVGTLLSEVSLGMLGPYTHILDCSFPLVLNVVNSAYDKNPVDISQFRTFSTGDYIKITGYLYGSLCNEEILTEYDHDKNYSLDNELFLPYSNIINILKQYETSHGFSFEFIISKWKWKWK